MGFSFPIFCMLFQGTGEVNEHGGVEKKVETVDYRKSAGLDGKPPKKEIVKVIHRTDENEDPGALANLVRQ